MKSVLVPLRCQPPHIGHEILLKKIISEYDKIIILVYTTKELNFNNPFNSEERKEMIINSLTNEELNKCEIEIMPYFENVENRIDFVESLNEFNIDTDIVTGSEAVKNIFEEKGHKIKNSHNFINNEIDLHGGKFREMIIDENPKWSEYSAKGTIEFNKKINLKNRIDSFKQL